MCSRLRRRQFEVIIKRRLTERAAHLFRRFGHEGPSSKGLGNFYEKTDCDPVRRDTRIFSNGSSDSLVRPGPFDQGAPGPRFCAGAAVAGRGVDLNVVRRGRGSRGVRTGRSPHLPCSACACESPHGEQSAASPDARASDPAHAGHERFVIRRKPAVGHGRPFRLASYGVRDVADGLRSGAGVEPTERGATTPHRF